MSSRSKHKTLEQATDRFTQELDLVRTKLVALNEAKQRDSIAISNLNKTVNSIQHDITNIAEKTLKCACNREFLAKNTTLKKCVNER